MFRGGMQLELLNEKKLLPGICRLWWLGYRAYVATAKRRESRQEREFTDEAPGRVKY
jgi:hypothetical protein